MRAPLQMRRAWNQLYVFDFRIVKDLDRFSLSTLPGEAALKEELSWSLCNLIINTAVESAYKSDRHLETAHYTSSYRLLTSYVKKGESEVKLRRRWAAFHVQIGTIKYITALDIAKNEEIYLSVSCCQYILTARYHLDQTGHHSPEVWEWRRGVGAQGL